VGVKLERLLESRQGVGVVFFVGVINPQQVVAIDAGRIPLEFFLYFAVGLIDGTAAKQFFCFLEKGRNLQACPSITAVGDSLLRKTLLGKEKHYQRRVRQRRGQLPVLFDGR